MSLKRLKSKVNKSYNQLPFERRCAIAALAREEENTPEMQSLYAHYHKEHYDKKRRKKIVDRIMELRNGGDS